MARIAGVDIPREKRVEIALTYIFGLGLPTSQKILAQTNINPDTRVRDLTEEQVNRLRELIDRRYKVEGFVKNVENSDVISNDGLQSITLGQQAIEPDNFVYFPPRTFGVRLSVNFGG